MSNRDDFTPSTRLKLAQRVAFRCSYAGCRKITIGPDMNHPMKVLDLGTAAHITAAAPSGPRYDSTPTPKQRRDISNGIWMCTHHGRLIDSDHLNYSVATLQQWKTQMEQETHDVLCNETRDLPPEPRTLLALGYTVICEGSWRSGEPDRWAFKIHRFLQGTLPDYIEQYDTLPEQHRFVVVESQGDGRPLKAAPRWDNRADGLHLQLEVGAKAPRTNPETLGENLKWENFSMIKGTENALQQLDLALSLSIGTWVLFPHLGHRWHALTPLAEGDLRLQARLWMLDLARMVSVPPPEEGASRPQLNFIERVLDLHITSVTESHTEIEVTFQWYEGERWTGTYQMSAFAYDPEQGLTRVDALHARNLTEPARRHQEKHRREMEEALQDYARQLMENIRNKP